MIMRCSIAMKALQKLKMMAFFSWANENDSFDLLLVFKHVLRLIDMDGCFRVDRNWHEFLLGLSWFIIQKEKQVEFDRDLLYSDLKSY